MKYAFAFTCGFFILLWERLWSRFWLPAAVTLFYAALALSGVPLSLDAPWRMLLLGGYAAALALALLKEDDPFVFPTRAAVERRLERAGGLAHRPLQALRDKPATPLAPETERLWRRHVAKAAAAVALLKLFRPRTDVARRDKWHLRHAALFLFALGLAVARGDAAARLRQSFTPDFGARAIPQPLALDLWIEPPAYTHQANIFLSTAERGITVRNAPLRVPAGSILKLRLSGLRFAPRVTYAGQKIPAVEAAPRDYALDRPLEKSGKLVIGSFFRTLGAWQIATLPDTPPVVSIVKVETTPFAAVKITYKANDDHGITKLTAIVGADGKAYSFVMPPPANTGKPGADAAADTEDMTANPAAGERATLWLDAEDGAGHITSSAPASFVLPERHFTNPLAQRIVLDRKILIHEKSAGAREAVVRDLAEIADRPQAYKGDFTVFLSLASAAHRLAYDRRAGTPPSVIGLLWNLALRLEDGGLTRARDALESALQKLRQAITDKTASKAQLQEMLGDVRQAMRQYLTTLAGELAQKLSQGQGAPHLSPELAARLLQNIDVSRLVAEMQALTNAGSAEALQKMAAMLKNTLDGFDINAFSQIQKQQAQAMAALQSLQDIVHRQQELYDRTNKAAHETALRNERHAQVAIRDALGKSMAQMAAAGVPLPGTLAAARQAMKNAAAALGSARRADALAQQQAALDDLRQGLDNTVKKIARALQGALLPFGMAGGGGFGAGYDPLGRPYGAADGVKIPDKSRQRRVQQIIDELQQRESDPGRSDIERNYINRLLDQF
ncbi:MAG: DUF4175 family protein [Alphaproteobacteria bacterium]|nr:DUF4175 family protein [Alphaproteobacteria bacterium]